MIRVVYRGRLGNNLFQYCIGRILSTELQLSLLADPIPGFPGTARSSQREPADLQPGEQRLTGHVIDLEGLLTDRRPRRIRLDGFFMRYAYYRGYKDVIRNDSLCAGSRVAVGEQDLTIHVRSGDLWQTSGGLRRIPTTWVCRFPFTGGLSCSGTGTACTL